MKNEKHYIRKYRLISLALMIVMLASIPVVGLSVKSPTIMLFCALAICILGFFAMRIVIRKVLLSVLIDDLNAPLFRKIVRKGKFVAFQLWSEYYCGNFGNVVEICRKKLADRKAAKKGRYMYLQNLAAVYYVTGDSESLQEVCQQVEEYLKTEKPSIKRKQAAYIKFFDFYNAYLAGDWGSCETFGERQVKTKLDRITRVHTHARLALAKGEVERAKELFEEMRQTPNLCYATFAEEGLRAIEEGTPYGEGFAPISVTDDFYVMYPSKAIKFLRRASVVAMIIGCILLWVSAGLEITNMLTPEPQPPSLEVDPEKIGQLSQDIENYQRYKEDLRVLVEKDYDHVEVLETFHLMRKEESLESMFLFKTDKSLLLATVYIHTGDEETYYYKVQTLLPLSDLEKPSMVRDFSFDCVTSNASASVRDCVEQVSIPLNDGYLELEINGKTVYLVLLSIKENE